MGFTVQQYREDVLEAHKNGKIILGEGADLWGKYDNDSIYSRFDEEKGQIVTTSNRALKEVIYSVICYLKKTRESILALELGAGAGVGSFQMAALGCEVDTISMTALSPNIAPLPGLPCGDLREILSNQRGDYYRRTKKPFIQEQRIGKLGETIFPNPDKKYHLIHERCGPLHYLGGKNEWNDAFSPIADALADDGILVLDPCIYPDNYQKFAETKNIKMIRDYPEDEDATVILLMKPKCPLITEVEKDRNYVDGIAQWLRGKIQPIM